MYFSRAKLEITSTFAFADTLSNWVNENDSLDDEITLFVNFPISSVLNLTNNDAVSFGVNILFKLQECFAPVISVHNDDV